MLLSRAANQARCGPRMKTYANRAVRKREYCRHAQPKRHVESNLIMRCRKGATVFDTSYHAVSGAVIQLASFFTK